MNATATQPVKSICVGDTVRIIGCANEHTVLSVVSDLIGGPHAHLTDCGATSLCDCRGLTAFVLLKKINK
jgi:hypothetical protein